MARAFRAPWMRVQIALTFALMSTLVNSLSQTTSPPSRLRKVVVRVSESHVKGSPSFPSSSSDRDSPHPPKRLLHNSKELPVGHDGSVDPSYSIEEPPPSSPPSPALSVASVIEAVRGEVSRRRDRRRRRRLEGLPLDDAETEEEEHPFIASIDNTFTAVLPGFVATLSPAAIAFLEEMEGVSVWEDVTVRAASLGPPIPFHPRSQRSRLLQETATGGSIASVIAMSWGLDRIDQTSLPLDGRWRRSAASTGEGPDTYIVDSGVRATHTEIANRIIDGANFVDDQPLNTFNDCAGHGTHISGTVGGRMYGVAPGARLIIVRVYGCDASGPLTAVLRGFDWILNRMKSPQGAGRKAIINLSFATDHIVILDEAVAALANAGAVVVVAAGNTASDACGTSPASSSLTSTGVITVGSSDSTDAFSTFSDFGRCVSIVAPGRRIISAGIESNTALATMSGTSMAAPHVTGVLAAFFQAFPTVSTEAAVHAITCTASKGFVSALPNVATPNLLLHFPPSGFPQSCIPEGSVSAVEFPSDVISPGTTSATPSPVVRPPGTSASPSPSRAPGLPPATPAASWVGQLNDVDLKTSGASAATRSMRSRDTTIFAVAALGAAIIATFLGAVI